MKVDVSSNDDPYVVAQKLAAVSEYARAIDLYTVALDRDVNHCKARCGRGIALQRIGQHAEAIADFSYVIEHFRSWPGVYVAFYSRAVSRHTLGEYVETISDCNESIIRHVGSVDALYLRGIARESLGQFEEASDDMSRILAGNPSYITAYYIRGRLRVHQCLWSEAVEDLTVAISQMTSDSDGFRQSLYLRGIALQEVGKHRLAIEDFSLVIDGEPTNAGAYLRRSRSYRELRETSLADADMQSGSQLAKNVPKPLD